uniref:Right handed beta helix domain-containing protein n=1 Tax=Corethron hystrix TaxID=216773 RepID=A0A6U5G6M8_9STRA|mmetsp:Transcript_2523/g.4815  ORF Transcript_2523/g.4815 Transcript_2523/m.4815 type:complete len:1208 (+) Transcript_2523:112-3735(+)
MSRHVILIAALLLGPPGNCSPPFPVAAAADTPTTVWFVDPSSGSDDPSNPGTDASSPLRTVQRCVDIMVTHSSSSGPPPSPPYADGVRGRCILAGGVDYGPTEGGTGRAGAVVEGLRGTSDGIYEIASADPSEPATFVGYEELDDDAVWTYVQGGDASAGEPTTGHWVTNLSEQLLSLNPWQLFVDGEMYVNARWPDARWDDRSVFLVENWQKSTWDGWFEKDIEKDSWVVDGSGQLAAGGYDVVGASVVLNVKHWFTFATTVTNFLPEENKVVYRVQPGWKGDKWAAGKDAFFLENKPEFISQETEWHLDMDSGVLRVALRGGTDADPSSLRIGLRVQEYALRIADSSDLRLQDLRFFGTTVYAAALTVQKTVNGVEFDSLTFEHPSAMKRMAGDHRYSWPTTLYDTSKGKPSRNRIFNCTLVGNEGHPTTRLRGDGMVLENNLFRDVDFTAVTTVPCTPSGSKASLWDGNPSVCTKANYVGGGTALEASFGTVSNPTIVRRNTINTYGGSSGLTVGKNTEVELNRIHGAMALQLDGALVQGGGHDRYEVGDRSDRWAPTLCGGLKTSEDCIKAGCEWSDGDGSCSGDPSEEYLSQDDNLPPQEAIDGSSYFGVVYRQNWLYDAKNDRISKRGLRFDRPQATCNGRFGNTWTNHGSMVQNVAWNTNGIMVKGSQLRAERNTITGSGSGVDGEGSNIRDLTVYDEFSEGTCTCNSSLCRSQALTCCVPGDDATFEGRTNVILGNLLASEHKRTVGNVDHLFPGRSEGNLAGPEMWGHLRDPWNLDFRPMEGSPVAINGTGAYGYEESLREYFIPGRREWLPSSPIPPEGTQGAKLDTDLMFLPRLSRHSLGKGGRDGDGKVHVVYAACSPERLGTLGPEATRIELSGQNNVAAVAEQLARPGRTVHWRVDTEEGTRDGAEALTGKAWSYTYVNPYSDENAEPLPPGRCQKYATSSPVNFTDFELSGKPVTVSSVAVDAREYGSEKYNYTLVSGRVCFNVTDATAGVQKMQLRIVTPAGPLALKMGNAGSGTTFYETCFTDDAAEKLSSSAGDPPFQGDWLPHKAGLMKILASYPGEKASARMLVKDHGDRFRDFPGMLDWSLELCYNGWEDAYEDWSAGEAERIRKRDEEAARPWCEDPITAMPSQSPSKFLCKKKSDCPKETCKKPICKKKTGKCKYKKINKSPPGSSCTKKQDCCSKKCKKGVCK